MATIVRHTPTGRLYVLVGTGFGATHAVMPSVLGGSLFPTEKVQEIPVAAVSDSLGNIAWLYTRELQVVEVDGTAIGDYFSDNGSADPAASCSENAVEEVCPGCLFAVKRDAA
ncbi:hypothetical protein [Paenibacillus xerothermodurans]|uniref:Uncharacterized protein n=1 Tax=Paenibacillus xerothermodurans TaxID=1977292 RepID=A0A2W1N8W7_PAEXE|nr:hypothetical protein [Paenibacillus xerothermodurans]PZE19581.1 hypothetical protein CBW46_017855 [Paenibacillus xerothermodurans]